jgi:hypothetical protein
VQRNFGRMDGFLQRPTGRASNPGVTLAKANTFPAGYYCNRNGDGTRKAAPDLLADIRLSERFIADAYHALANAGYLDNTALQG